jgi:hypothetical protein
MSHFFIDLVSRTDEARRSFEAHPVVLDAVANGLSLDRYRVLLSELYSLVLHFNPGCAAAASRMSDRFPAVRSFLYEHMHEESGHEAWVLDDLEAIGSAKTAACGAGHDALHLGRNAGARGRVALRGTG